jgi:excisionase family DNA binding protein
MPDKPLRWGWFAAVRGIESGHWMTPTAASDLLNVHVRSLSNWAKAGVISYIQMEPRQHRRYLREELEELLKVFGVTPNLWLIRDYIAKQLVEGDEDARR